MNAIQLSPAQQAILAHAIDHTEGRVEWFPDSIKGGAQRKVIDAMFNRALISYPRPPWWRLRRRGSRKKPRNPAPERTASRRRCCGCCNGPRGATIAQICWATGWQAHTVRGAFAGAFKKKMGLTITSEKVEGAERVYRVG